MSNNDNVMVERQNSKRKRYRPDENLKWELKSFRENTKISVVDSDRLSNVGKKEFLEVKHGQKNWRARETDSHPSHHLSSHGDICSSACLILVRCIELGEPDVIYIPNEFDNLKEIAQNCEVTAEWHIVDGVSQLSLRVNQGTQISISQLEKLASAYMRGGSDE
jgi:hypothetical protein